MFFEINPQFEHIRPFIESLPYIFECEGNTIYTGRNKIKTYQIDNLIVNVKSYKKPIFPNQIIYSFFRKSKCQRAYEHALELQKLGIETPTPIAYIEEKKVGLLTHSYFICNQCNYPNTFHIFSDKDTSIEGKEKLLTDFAKFTADIHKKGVYHKDYSPGNILFEEIDGKFHFSLIDINRMEFCKIKKTKGCKNFARFVGCKEMFVLLAKTYAQEMQYDEKECIDIILKAKKADTEQRARKRIRKEKIKKILGKA